MPSSAGEDPLGQRVLVRRDPIHAEPLQVLDGGAAAHGLADPGVPASKRAGGALNVAVVMVTSSTIEPPTSSGGIASSTSRRPAVLRGRSGPASCGREGREVDPEAVDVDRGVRHRLAGVEHGEGADARARAASSATGFRVPSTFDTCVNASTLVRGRR